MRASIVPLLLILLVSVFALTLPAPAAYTRWAVITSGTPEEGQLSDLLVAGLSKVPGLELVEREQIAGLAHEQALSGACSAEGSADRLQLGKILRADALLLTELTGTKDTPEIRIIIADTRYGVRLYSERLSWNTENIPALAAHVQEQVLTVRTRFAAGLTRIYGVPQLVSQSLSREYEPLQTRYAGILANTLSLQPGVAVIETEEAKAIGRELALGGDPELQRLVPALISGEFRVEPGTEGNEPAIHLTVTVSDGGKTLASVESGNLPLSAAPAWLATGVVMKILTTGAVKPLTVDEQAHALLARAATFAQLGSRREAVQLREAALLLMPDQAQVHQDQYTDYYLLIQKIIARRMQQDARNMPAEESAADYREWLDYYTAMAGHAAYLFRHQAITGEQALDVLMQVMFAAHLNYQQQLDGLAERDETFRQQLVDAQRAHRELLESATRNVLLLPRQMDEKAFGEKWHRQFQVIPLNIAGRFASPEDDRFSQRIYLEIPADVDFRFPECPDYKNDEEAKTYIDIFRNDPRPLMHIVGEYMGLSRKYRQLRQQKILQHVNFDDRRKSEIKDAITTLGRLLDEYARLGQPASPNASRLDLSPGYISLRSLQQNFDELINAAAPPAGPSRMLLSDGALMFAPVELRASGVPLRLTFSSDLQILTCSDTVEFIKVNNALYLHERPGELKLLHSFPGPDPTYMVGTKTTGQAIGDLAWDGARLWMVVLPDIWVLAPDGTVLAKVTKEQGLPEARTPVPHALLLQSISNGRILAVGSFGDMDLRGWIAELHWDEKLNRPAPVRLVHEARKTAGNGEWTTAPDVQRDTALGFLPKSMTTFAPLPGKRAVMIGRNGPQYTAFMPLVVDEDTLAVSTLNTELKRPETYPDPHRSSVHQDDVLIQILYDRALTLARPMILKAGAVEADGRPAWRPIPVTNPQQVDPANRWISSEEKVDFVGDPMGDPRVLLPARDGWIYVPGAQWWRIDPKTLTAQRLTPWHERTGVMRYAVSNLLGLLYYRGDGKLYRVTVDETRIPKTGE